MTPFEFGYSVGQQEKSAAPSINMGSIFARLAQAGRGVATGAKTINQGAKHLVRGFGGGIEGLGQATSGAAGLAKGVGREAMKGGKGVIDHGAGNTGMYGDVMSALGFGGRAAGRAARGVGHVTDFAGKALQAGGRGLSQLADTSYGVPSLVAAGLLGGTASVAPKLPLPGVKFRSPIDVDFNYKTQRPVELEW
jgi:hypothetical protein